MKANVPNWRDLLEGAYSSFHDISERSREEFPGLVDYEICQIARDANGTHAWSWGVPGEITETINGINAWSSRLHEWSIWLKVLQGYDDEASWELESHFVEPLAFYCMYQPSAVAERLAMVAENAIHQANMAVKPGLPDRLDQDALQPGQRLSLKARRKQLDRLGDQWSSYRDFRDHWVRIDSKRYRELSRNYRNLSSHSIAPRFRHGETMRIERAIVPTTRMMQLPNGEYQSEVIPDRKCVSYVFGVVLPMGFEEAYTVNRKQLALALATMGKFRALVEEMSVAMSGRTTGG